MIRRGILHFFGAGLLTLSIALAAGWVRSYAHQDSLYRMTVDARGIYSLPMFLSDNGRVAFIYRSADSNPLGPVQRQSWTRMARPHFYEFEEVRWASYDVSTVGMGRIRKTQVVVRYWFLLSLALLMGLAWFQLERRYRKKHPPGHCAACGYDLRGTVSGVCPECGSHHTSAINQS